LVYYGIHEDIGKPVKYIVFLRSPHKKYESLFNHVRIENKKSGKEVPGFERWISQYYEETMINELTRGSQFQISVLEQSKHILDMTSYIGLQETFEEDVRRILSPNIHIKMANVTETKAKECGIEMVRFSDKEIEVVNDILSKDLELYKYGIWLRSQGHNNGFSHILET